MADWSVEVSNSSEELAINELIDVSRSMFNRGYSFGTAGNVGILVGETVFATTTGASLRSLERDRSPRCAAGAGRRRRGGPRGAQLNGRRAAPAACPGPGAT